MKLGLLPLLKAQNFSGRYFTTFSLETLSLNALGELAGYLIQHFPSIQVSVQLKLGDTIKFAPDIVLLWSTSSNFGQAQDVAESLKSLLNIPVWIAGPHISHLPQSLPPAIDLGIMGEPELPMHQLLQLWQKHGEVTMMQYRRIPGLIYQSRGRMYSGAPAQLIPRLSEFPRPFYRFWTELPSLSSPVLRSARINDNLLTTAVYPPSRKARSFTPQQLCDHMELAISNYDLIHQSFPLEVQQYKRFFRPITIIDHQLFVHPERLKVLCEHMLRRNLPQRMFLVLHAPPESLRPEIMAILGKMNVKRLMFSLGPLGHQNPLLSQASAPQIIQALELCDRYNIRVFGNFFINPDIHIQRKQLARTYRFLNDHRALFNILQITTLGPVPGTELWESYQQQHKLTGQQLLKFPWHSLDWDEVSPDLPLFNKHLDRKTLREAHLAFARMSDADFMFRDHHQEELGHFNRAKIVQAFARQCLRPGEEILELVVDPKIAATPFLSPYFTMTQMRVRYGQIHGTPPHRPVDVLLIPGAFNGLRDPEESLRKVLEWLKPGGRLYLNSIHPENIEMLMKFLQWPASQSFIGYPTLKFYKPEQIIEIMYKLGLQVVETNYNIMNNVEAVRPVVETLANRLDHFADQRISQERLYVAEITLEARKPDA